MAIITQKLETHLVRTLLNIRGGGGQLQYSNRLKMKQKNQSTFNHNISSAMFPSIPPLTFPCCWEEQLIRAVPIPREERSPCEVLFNRYYTNFYIKVCKQLCICKSPLKTFQWPSSSKYNSKHLFCLNLFSIQQYQLSLERSSSSN